jgi:hypothetical protein
MLKILIYENKCKFYKFHNFKLNLYLYCTTTVNHFGKYLTLARKLLCWDRTSHFHRYVFMITNSPSTNSIFQLMKEVKCHKVNQIFWDESVLVSIMNMWHTCSRYKISIRKPEGKGPLGKHGHRWEYNIKMVNKKQERLWGCTRESTGLGQGK